MNQRIFDNSKLGQKQLKSPRIFKTEGNYLYNIILNINYNIVGITKMILLNQNNTQYLYTFECNQNKAKSYINDRTGFGQRDYSEKQSQFTKNRVIVNNYSQQSRQQLNTTHNKYNSFLDSILKLNKSKEMSRVPMRSRKQMWHNYVSQSRFFSS